MRITLWIIGLALILFWLGTLFERNFGKLFIDVDKNTLFLGLSILLAGWMIVITRPSEPSKHLLALHYVNFAQEIGVQELTLEQLAKEVGNDTSAETDDKGIYRTIKVLDDSQRSSLKTLVYEGKICIRNNRYSLPKRS